MLTNTVKVKVCASAVYGTCSRMNSPVNQTNRFFHGFLVSDSVEITSILVYILKQLFTSGSVNIVNFAFGE